MNEIIHCGITVIRSSNYFSNKSILKEILVWRLMFEINGLAANISYFKCPNLVEDQRKSALMCFIDWSLQQEEIWD